MRYTLRVSYGDEIMNIWVGDDMSEAIRLEGIAIKQWGKDNVWIADAIQEFFVG